ncbi:MAG: hypothetical protein ACP5VS_02565, partial [Desulfomonilaceae bacterium]
DKGRSPSSQKAKPEPNELKRGNKPYRQGKQGIKPTRHPETGQPAVKQDKKKIRNENSVIGGRPDLKPEFAKPDRAPGPPLGDTPGDDDKKKRH